VLCFFQGVLDVPCELLVDIDETGVVLYSAERGFGYSLKGTRAVALSRSQRGTKFTVILAISSRGVVCWDISNENTTAEKFRNFLNRCLNPALQRRGLLTIID